MLNRWFSCFFFVAAPLFLYPVQRGNKETSNGPGNENKVRVGQLNIPEWPFVIERATDGHYFLPCFGGPKEIWKGK